MRTFRQSPILGCSTMLFFFLPSPYFEKNELSTFHLYRYIHISMASRCIACKKKMVAGLEDVWIIQDLVLREWFICRGLGDCRTAYLKWRKIAQDRFSSMWSESLTPCPGRSAFDQDSGARSYERQDHNTLLFFLNILRVFQRPFLACLFFFRLVPLLLLFFRSKKGLFKVYFTSQAWWM